MEEQVKAQDELSLSEILKILLRKIKLLLITLVCGAIVGTGLAVIQTANVDYYGTTVQFYINPTKEDGTSSSGDSQYGVYGSYGQYVMDNIVRLLESELFAEKLVLESDGLPSDELVASLNNADLTEKIALARTAKAEATTKADVAATALTAYNTANATLTQRNETVNALWAAYKAANPNVTGSTPTTVDGQTQLNEAITARNRAEMDVAAANIALEHAQEESAVYAKTANKATESALSAWRDADVAYKDKISLVKESVSYSYLEEGTESSSNLARSFIYVKIEVLNDEDYAKTLLARMRALVPEFVEENMPVPSGYTGTRCQRITRLDSIELTNEGYMFTTIVKYALLLGAASLIVACVVVVIVDRSNKRLRDFEQTMEKFDVPVLGVIPSIAMKELKVYGYGNQPVDNGNPPVEEVKGEEQK